jgi:LPXTG-motif cell wall-anchored protein
VGSSATPRLSSSFQQICGSTEPVEGKKRVGLVIDFGTAADAPAGQTPPNGPVARCVVAPTTANGYEILASVTSLRVEAGMICGLAGYPTSGCGEAVKSPKPTKNPQPASSGSDTGGAGSPSANAQNPSTSQNSKDNDPGDEDKGGKNDDGKKSESKKVEARDDEGKTTPTEQESADAALAAASTSALPTTNSGSPMGALVGAAIIAALLAGAVWLTRKRRTTR